MSAECFAIFAITTPLCPRAALTMCYFSVPRAWSVNSSQTGGARNPIIRGVLGELAG